MKADYPDSVRQIKQGYGVTGIKLELSMAHIYSLMALQSDCKLVKEDPSLDPFMKNLVHQTLNVLDFIIQDIQSPMNPDLWKIE